MTVSFEWGNGVVHITPTTVGTRLRERFLNGLAGLDRVEDPSMQLVIFTTMYYLSHVDKVDGDIGFHVPNGHATEESLQEFIDNFTSADENLMAKWDKAILETRKITNGAKLLPPDEIDPNA